MSEKGFVHPLADVTPIWEHDFSVYPDIIRVAMDDGRVVNYCIDVQMPNPAFQRVMGLLKEIPYGPSEKGYRARHAKK